MISGSIVALLTPMHQGTLEVDWDALKKLVDWHIEQGTNSIVAVGTTGESATQRGRARRGYPRCGGAGCRAHPGYCRHRCQFHG